MLLIGPKETAHNSSLSLYDSAGVDLSAATIDRILGDVKVTAAGGRRRRAGFYSAIRREVPIRTFNDWKDPAPGFCEVDMVAHGGLWARLIASTTRLPSPRFFKRF